LWWFLSPAITLAGPRTVVLVPDANCARDRLVGLAEEGMVELADESLKIVRPEPGKSASIVVNYFLLVQEERNQVVVQIEGRAFENHSGKLLAEGSASSEPQANDVPGRQAAARQAGQRLALALSPLLKSALSTRAKGRRVMLQVTLEEDAAVQRDKVQAVLQSSLREGSPRQKGSTERNLVFTLHTSDSIKELVSAIDKGLSAGGAFKPTWVLQSDSTLILRVARGAK
jgi:hypothetical protein